MMKHKGGISSYYHGSFILFFVLSLFFFTSLSYAFDLDQKEYLFSADRVVYDDEYGLIIAVGDVEIIGQQETLRADIVTIYEQDNRVEAEGNIAVQDLDGNVFYTDALNFSDDGNNVFTKGIRALMADNSRITGVSGQRLGNGITVINRASYSPCLPCVEDPDAALSWQLNAKKIIHDETLQRIKYYNTSLSMYGVPVFWLPYFHHPDPSVKQLSGFLTPEYGFKSDLGWIFGSSYYFALASDKDITTRLRWTGDQGPVGDVEYRQRFDKGEFSIRGSLTQSDRFNDDDTIDRDELRGHLESKLNYHLDENWRTGFNIFRASDDQYARLYDYSSRSVYENRGYVEGFFDRDLASAELFYFQDVRLGEAVDQPAVFPWLRYQAYGDPNSMLGGRLHGDASFLGLVRDGEGQDVLRTSLYGDWQREYASSFGWLSDLTLSAQSDFYYIQDRDEAALNPLIDNTRYVSRILPQAHLVSRLPLVKYFGDNKDKQFLLEPTVSFTAAPRVSNNDIPNEDSQDLLLDWSNLFSQNRFNGDDRLEDGVRTTYGLRGSVFSSSETYGSVFLGQSYRLSSDNIYLENSGLTEDFSDYVGGVSFVLNNNISMDYNSQFSEDSFNLRRHELRGRLNYDRFRAGLSYFYDRGVAGTNLNNVREQILPSFSVDIADNWRVNGAALYDFSDSQEGLIRANGGLTYYNDCLEVNLSGRRNLVDRATGDSNFEFLISLDFKNLGAIQSPSFGFSDDGDRLGDDNDFND